MGFSRAVDLWLTFWDRIFDPCKIPHLLITHTGTFVIVGSILIWLPRHSIYDFHDSAPYWAVLAHFTYDISSTIFRHHHELLLVTMQTFRHSLGMTHFYFHVAGTYLPSWLERCYIVMFYFYVEPGSHTWVGLPSAQPWDMSTPCHLLYHVYTSYVVTLRRGAPESLGARVYHVIYVVPSILAAWNA